MFFTLIVSFCFIFVVFGQIEYHHCHHKVEFGKPNTFPILDGHKTQKLIKTVKNGKLYHVTVPQSGVNSSNTFNLIHVWGSPFERGEAQGQLLGSRITDFLSNVWTYLEGQVSGAIKSKVSLPKWLLKDIADVGLDAALDATALATRPWTGKYFFEELHGLCAGAGASGSGCYNTALRIHMIAGLTQGHCSLFGSWGKASAKGHTLQLRALDWNMDGPFRDDAAVTVYHAQHANENSFAMVGMGGFVGALTGVSDKQVGISEIGVSYPDGTFGAQSRFGIPFIFLLRDILQFDQTLDDAVSRMADTRRTCDLILGVGDAKLGYVRGIEYSDSVLDVMDDYNMRPTNDTWHFKIPEMVYWGMDWLCPGYTQVLGTQLKKHWGKLTPEIAIRDVMAVEMSGDVHIAVYDLTQNELFVSFAAPHGTDGPQKAYARQYTRFSTTQLFAETKP